MGLLNFYKKYEEKYTFEGDQRELYNDQMQKWLILSIFSVFFPLLITIITDGYEKQLDFAKLINSGDTILSSFSLTIPTIIDMFESYKTVKNRDTIFKASQYICLAAVFIQAILYVLVRTHKAELLTNLICTLIIVPSSVYICRYCIFCIFVYSSDIQKEGGK